MADQLESQSNNDVQHPGGATTESPAASPGAPPNADRRIEVVPISTLKPYKGNARTHSGKQIRQITDSIRRFGFNNPVLIDDAGEIIAGHGRVKAAKLLGLSGVPALRLSHLSPAEKRAYILADNKLAEKAGWDREILAIELQGLVDLDFNVEFTGFEAGEIDLTLADADAERREAAGPGDQIPEPVPGDAVSRLGDLWQLDKHRLYCGDARDGAAYDVLLGSDKASFVFSDPPYNVGISGHASRSALQRDREFAVASGELSPQAFTDFLATVFAHLVAHTEDGSIHDICMDWRHIGEMREAGRRAYTELKNVCVWAKSHFGMGGFYRSQHELIFIWKAGAGPHLNNLPFAHQGRNRSNLWSYASVMRAGQSETYGFHPTVKPVALVADAIKDCSRRGGVVLDPFLGSGTTLIAAEQTGRRARGIEIDPAYVDVAIKRWQTYTGKKAVLAATGQTFEEVEEARLRPSSPTPEIAPNGMAVAAEVR